MKKTTFFSAVIAGSLLSGASLLSGSPLPASVSEFQPSIQEVLPAAGDYKQIDSHSYDVLGSDGAVLGRVVFNSLPKAEMKIGFAGPVPVAVILGNDGKIKDVVLGKNEETPAFLNRVKKAGFLHRWNGLRLTEILNHKVDAVSGATRSSSAIRSNVESIGRDAARKAGMKVSAQEKSDIAGLHARMKKIKQGIAFCQSFIDQWKTKENDEIEVRFIYAVEGKEAGDKAARDKEVKIFKHHGLRMVGAEAQKLADDYKAAPSAEKKAAVLAAIRKDLLSLQKGMQEHKVEMTKSLNAVVAQLRREAKNYKGDLSKIHSRSAQARKSGMMHFRSPEAQQLEAQIQALAEAYKKAPGAETEKALRAALQEQLNNGVKAMAGFIAKKEAELKKLKATYDGIADDTDKVIEERFQSLTAK